MTTTNRNPNIITACEMAESYAQMNRADYMLSLHYVVPAPTASIDFMISGLSSCSHELIIPPNIFGVYRCVKCGLRFALRSLRERNRREVSKQMCTADEERVIKMKVEEFLQQGKMFTSVDIANEIKLSGTWIRNRDVAGYLRGNAMSLARMLMIVYRQTMIPVTLDDGTTTETYLYYPMGMDANDYTNTNQRALGPIDANHPRSASIHVQSVPPIVSTPTPVDTTPSFDIKPWRVTSV
jgi:hypothetical protein